MDWYAYVWWIVGVIALVAIPLWVLFFFDD